MLGFLQEELAKMNTEVLANRHRFDKDVEGIKTDRTTVVISR